MHNIREESPDNFTGSMSDEQISSRLWMAHRLSEIKQSINICAVLGSWYGVLPYVLNRNLNVKEIIAIDSEPGCIKVSQRLNPTLSHITKDCNKLKYKGVDCVVNPSINNIINSQWYDHIEPGCLCLFQTENIANEKGTPKDLTSLKKQFSLSKYLYEGTLRCEDSDGFFVRSMVIGYK